MKKILLVWLVLFNSGHVLANALFSSAKVSKIILHDSPRVLVYLDTGLQTNEDCSSKSFIVLQTNSHHYKEMYSALLSAYHSGSRIGGWVNGCDDRFNAPILTRLDLMPK